MTDHHQREIEGLKNTHKMSMKRTITILQHNVRNWKTRRFELYNTYRVTDPDIILINEHGQKTNEKIKLFNYDVYQSNKSNEYNDGVAIAVKTNIEYKIIDDFNQEVMAIKLNSSIGEIIIATTYLPPRRSYLPVEDFLRLANYNKPTYILGDFNARHRSFGHNNNNNVGNSLYNLMNYGKLINLGPNFKTFIGHSSMTTPDRVFSNNKASLNYYLRQGPLTSSDHIPMIMTLSTSPIQIPTKERYLIHKANWETFKLDMNKVKEIKLDNKQLEDIDKELENFHETIKLAMKKNIPKSHYKTLPHSKIPQNIRFLQTHFIHLHNYIQINGPDLSTMHRIKQLQQQLQDSYRIQKNEEWDTLIENIDENTDPKKFWKLMKMANGKEKIRAPYVKDTNGDKLYDDEEQELAFRNIWKQVFKISEEENEDFDLEHEEQICDWLRGRINETTPKDVIDMKTLCHKDRITERELLHNLRKFKEKTPGLTGITRNIIMNIPEKGINILLEIFNASLAAGYFPDELKKTKMIFIPKEGKDSKEIINYRPISLLEVTGKLFEKILNARLLKYLENNKILNMRQHGFRQNRGTHTALAIITETIAIAKAKQENVNLILRDIKKAFDKVWHNGLKYKILKTNLPSFMKTILCDYLSDRLIQINRGQFLGPPFEIESGVPQGGCLSPTLFILYTSDMPTPSPYSEYITFADDVTQIVSYPGKSKELLAMHTRNAIENINKYENKWKIQTNKTKFTIIPIGRNISAPIIIDGNIYPYSNEGKVLGLKITKSGYRKFIKEKINILRIKLIELKKLANLKDRNKIKLYVTLIRSILEYPPIPINAMKKSIIQELQIIQNKALRFIYNIRYPEVITNNELHERAGLKTIRDLLNERATSTWNRIESLGFVNNLNNIEEETEHELKQNNWFPLSYRTTT